jgi:hypothetical protein
MKSVGFAVNNVPRTYVYNQIGMRVRIGTIWLIIGEISDLVHTEQIAMHVKDKILDENR